MGIDVGSKNNNKSEARIWIDLLIIKMRSGKTREYVPAKPRETRKKSKKFEEEEESDDSSTTQTPSSTPEPAAEKEEEEKQQQQQDDLVTSSSQPTLNLEEGEDEDEDGDDDSSDEAPEEFGFQEAKETVAKEIKERKEKVKEGEDKKKDLKKRRLEQWKKEKDEKLKRRQEADKALPAHLLQQIGEEEKERQAAVAAAEEAPAAAKKRKKNKVTRLDNAGSIISIVSRKDERTLNNVADTVLNFKERMMFGGQRAAQRESVKVAAMRRQKALSINVLAK